MSDYSKKGEYSFIDLSSQNDHLKTGRRHFLTVLKIVGRVGDFIA